MRCGNNENDEVLSPEGVPIRLKISIGLPVVNVILVLCVAVQPLRL